MRVVLLLLVFLLGMVASVILVAVGGYYVASEVSLEGLEKFGIRIDTTQLFDDNANTPVRKMTVLELIGEIAEVSSMADTRTLDYFSEEYGLILPPEGESALLDAMRVIPLSTLFSQEGLDTALKNVYLGEVLGYVKKVDDTDPDNPREYWYDTVSGDEVTGIDRLLSDYTLYKLMYEGVVVSDLVDGEPVGVFLGYTQNEEGEWLDKEGNTLTGPMKFIADKMLSEVGDSLNNACIGEILGYELDPETGVWMKDGEAMTGAMKAFADNKLSNIEEGIEDAQIGTILGYDNVDGVWVKDGEPLTGSMLAFADDTIGSLEEEIDNKQIGLMLGYQYDQDNAKWYELDDDGNKVYMSGTMRAFADSTLANIEDSVKTAEIGTILGYDKIDGTWLKDGEPLTGSMLAFADDTLESLETEIDDKEIGLMLGYQYEEDSHHWYKLDDAGNKVYMSGTMRAFADCSLGNIEEGVKTAEIGIILGYDKDETTGTWTDNGTPVTGIMKSIAGEDLQHLGHNLEIKKLGELLDYKYISATDDGFVPVNPTEKNPNGDFPAGYWVDPSSDTPDAACSAFMQILADATFSTMDDLQSEITIGKLIPESERTGFVSLLDPETTIDEISDEVARAFEDATIGDLVKCGALTVDDPTKLDAIPGLKDADINELLDRVLNPGDYIETP